MSDIYHWNGKEFVSFPDDDLQDDIPDRLFSLVVPAKDDDREKDYDTEFVIHREWDDGPLNERQFVYLFDNRDQAETMAGEAREALGRVAVKRINVRGLDERFWVRLRMAFPYDPIENTGSKDAFLELWMSSETLRRHCAITNPLRHLDDDDD